MIDTRHQKRTPAPWHVYPLSSGNWSVMHARKAPAISVRIEATRDNALLDSGSTTNV